MKTKQTADYSHEESFYRDTAYSGTDCISMLAMKERGIKAALTKIAISGRSSLRFY